MAEGQVTGLDVTQRLPIEILQHCFWFLKLAEPPSLPGTPAGVTHGFQSPWSWPVQIENTAPRIEIYQHRPSLGWIKVSHVSVRWREAALGEKRLWAFVPEAATLSTRWFPVFIERSGVLPLRVDLSTVKYEASITRRPLVDIASPWIVPEVRTRIRYFTVRTTITRHAIEEDDLLMNIICDLSRHSPMLESLTLQANSRYYRTLPPESFRGAHNLRRLSLCQFRLPPWDSVPFSQITHLRLEIHPQTTAPDDMRLTGADLHTLLSSLHRIQSLELLGVLPHSPLSGPISLSTSCRVVGLGLNGPVIHTCLALLSSIVIPPQATISLLFNRAYSIFGMGYTAIPGILEHLFGGSNTPAAVRLSITASVLEVAELQESIALSRPSPTVHTSRDPRLSVRYIEPHDVSSDALVAALRKACFSGARALQIHCDQVAISAQMLQRIFDGPAIAQDSATELIITSASDVATLSLYIHRELYLRELPLWNIFDALAQKRAGGKPAFPTLQTLGISDLPFYTRWSLVGGSSRDDVYYVPPALIACLKTRRELGYPVASLQIPFKCKSADIENGLEGLVYLEYV
ncbi:unnamed protein product [Peniophora sp. CBMAI 1063]|nr:unnamed protein product [Peniophora sp. CBMAI 1063]